MKISGEVRVFSAILIAAAGLVGIVVYATRGPAAPPSEPIQGSVDAQTRAALLASTTGIVGNPKAAYALIEFGDYECASCATSDPEARRLADRYRDRMVYSFHQIRAARSHIHAPMMAKAAGAAAAQGKYWEMHSRLFAMQQDIHESGPVQSAKAIDGLAADLHLDMQRYLQYVNGESGAKFLRDEEALAAKLQIKGTPTFVFVRPDGHSTTVFSVVTMAALLNDPRTWQAAARP